MLHPKNAHENWCGAEPEDNRDWIETWGGKRVRFYSRWDDRDESPHFYDAQEWLEYADDEIWIPPNIRSFLLDAIKGGRFKCCGRL